jgi:cyclic dehypoxanthinyl futalosine synthase
VHLLVGAQRRAERESRRLLLTATSRPVQAVLDLCGLDGRNRIAPLKCNTEQWLAVMRIAHEEGLNSSATMMFGHVETVEDRIEHLQRLRDLQDATHGFTAFICWTFQPENVVLKATPVGSAEYLRVQALARIFLDNIENLQSSWVTQGPRIGQVALRYGANDFGSVMMEENVVSKAGTTFRIDREEIERLINDAGYQARTRNNWYELLPDEHP